MSAKRESGLQAGDHGTTTSIRAFGAQQAGRLRSKASLALKVSLALKASLALPGFLCTS
jgi:hypothetical protein